MQWIRKQKKKLYAFCKACTVCIKRYIVQIAKKYRYLIYIKSVLMVHLINILTHENTASSSSANLSPCATQMCSKNSTIGCWRQNLLIQVCFILTLELFFNCLFRMSVISMRKVYLISFFSRKRG